MGLLTERRILLLEDDYYLASDASDWLSEAGAEVVGPVATDEQALHLLHQKPVDAAVVDINLGQGPDFGFALLLNEQDVPIVFATGYDASAVPAEFRNSAIIEKPFGQNQLVEAVKRAVAERSLT